MDQLINAAYGAAALLFGFFILWALLLGLKEMGRYFRSVKIAKTFTMSPEEAAEVREAIDSYRMIKKAEKTAEAKAKA